MPDYPRIDSVSFGEIVIDGEAHANDVHIATDGAVARRKKKPIKKRYGTSHRIGPEELEPLCKGHPDVLVIGTGHQGAVELTPEGEEFLQARCIGVEALVTPDAVKAFNKAKGRKAAILHATC